MYVHTNVCTMAVSSRTKGLCTSPLIVCHVYYLGVFQLFFLGVRDIIYCYVAAL